MSSTEQCQVDGCDEDAVAVFEDIGLRGEVSRVTACDDHAPNRGGVHRSLNTETNQESYSDE